MRDRLSQIVSEGEGKIMYECDRCNDKATILVEGYLYARYLCSLHASILAGALGGSPSEVERMRVYA